MERKSFSHAEVLSGKLLVRIVRGQLSGVNDGVTHDVGDDTDPETSNTISSDNLFVAIKASSVTSLSSGKTSLSLESNLDNISGVGDGNTDSSGGHTSSDLSQERRVFSLLKRTSEHITDGSVETDTESSVNALALKPRGKSTPKSERSLFGGDHLGGP